MPKIATITGEGYASEIWTEIRDSIEHGWLIANGDVDADGANGQNGKLAAYRADGHGSELLGNGGLAIQGGRVVAIKDWAKDIVVFGSDGHPYVTSEGNLVSMTAYHYPGFDPSDPKRYVDAAFERYIVLPPVCMMATAGAVLGCHCIATHLHTGLTATGFVGDAGPRNKDGELSIAMAEAIGLDANPRAGGESRPIIRYDFFPGKAGKDRNGNTLRLQRLNGTYV